MLRLAALSLPLLFASVVSAQGVATPPEAAVDFDWPANARVAADRATPLDRYVHTPDAAYGWKVIRRDDLEGPGGARCQTLLVELTSQRWRSDDEVDLAVWKHWLTIIVPSGAKGNVGMLFVTGGANDGGPPEKPDDRVLLVALTTQSVVAELTCVPNQPTKVLASDDPEKGRYEDDLLAASWLRFMATKDTTWLAQLAMTKSAVAAMTATTEALAAEVKSDPQGRWPMIDRFVVAGASKRGWTTWLTGAVDNRVVAIAPIVIDMLNIRPSMAHHKASLGKWSEALEDYERAGLADKLDDPESAAIRSIIDPYSYRDRLTIPKCVINAASDEFFLPDSSRFYFDDLVGEKLLSYTPNAGHGLKGSNALETLIAFHASVVADTERPAVSWEGADDAAEHVVTLSAKPTKAVLWRVVNTKARDFRFPIIGPTWEETPLEPQADGTYRVPVEAPAAGYSATFARFTFAGPGAPLHVGTPVWIAPDTQPFAGGE
ncbi:MAG: PhoPQ-activated pathogenicity-related family protein [Lacipirellulaceae bacterium]